MTCNRIGTVCNFLEIIRQQAVGYVDQVIAQVLHYFLQFNCITSHANRGCKDEDKAGCFDKSFPVRHDYLFSE